MSWFARSSSYDMCHTYNEDNRPIIVERGEEVRFDDIILSHRWRTTGKDLVWKKATEEHEIGRCTGEQYTQGSLALRNISCEVQIGDAFQFAMHTNVFCNISTICALHIRITHTRLNDSGIYFVELDGGCRYMTANIIVRETKPVCTTIFLADKDKLELSCRWLSRSKDDKTTILNGNQKLYSYHNHGIINKTSSHEIRAVISLDDVLDENRVSFICVISQFGINKSCKFSDLQFSTKVLSAGKSTTLKSNYCFERKSCCEIWWYTRSHGLKLFDTESPNENDVNDFRDGHNESILILLNEKTQQTITTCAFGKLFLDFQGYARSLILSVAMSNESSYNMCTNNTYGCNMCTNNTYGCNIWLSTKLAVVATEISEIPSWTENVTHPHFPISQDILDGEPHEPKTNYPTTEMYRTDTSSLVSISRSSTYSFNKILLSIQLQLLVIFVFILIVSIILIYCQYLRVRRVRNDAFLVESSRRPNQHTANPLFRRNHEEVDILGTPIISSETSVLRNDCEMNTREHRRQNRTDRSAEYQAPDISPHQQTEKLDSNFWVHGEEIAQRHDKTFTHDCISSNDNSVDIGADDKYSRENKEKVCIAENIYCSVDDTDGRIREQNIAVAGACMDLGTNLWSSQPFLTSSLEYNYEDLEKDEDETAIYPAQYETKFENSGISNRYPECLYASPKKQKRSGTTSKSECESRSANGGRDLISEVPEISDYENFKHTEETNVSDFRYPEVSVTYDPSDFLYVDEMDMENPDAQILVSNTDSSSTKTTNVHNEDLRTIITHSTIGDQSSSEYDKLQRPEVELHFSEDLPYHHQTPD